MKKNLIFTGGIFHPFDETSKTLSKIINSFGYESEITIDIETGIKNINEFDLITFNALRWRMLNHEKYIPYIDEWQFSLSNKSRNLLEGFIKEGGKMLAFHTSSICFDDWDGWSKLLGGKWDWDKSYHPPIENVEVSPLKNHSLSKNIKNFQTNDEVYHNLKIEKNSQPFLSARSNTTKEDHIIGWTCEYKKGKTVYNALGHDSESLKNPYMIDIIKKSLEWLSGDKFVKN